MSDSDQWGVVVNEPGILGTRCGINWWISFWTNYSSRPNWTVLEHHTFMGGVYHIAFDNREDSDFARDHMISKGIPASQLQVRTLASARKSIQDKTTPREQAGVAA